MLLHPEQLAELLVLLLRLVGVFRHVEDLEAELLAGLGLEPVALGVVDADLALLVLHRVGDRHVLKEIDGTGLVVVAGLELTGHAEGSLRRRENRLLHRLDQDLGIDPLLLTDLLDDVL